MSDLVARGKLALSQAVALWNRRIVDPPRSTWREPVYDVSREAIDQMIRSAESGLGWSRCSALVKAYRHDGDYEWCGAFAARCWRTAGLNADLANLYWSSTYRLSRYGQGKIAFGTPRELSLRSRFPSASRACLFIRPETTLEDVARFGPRAGDVLLIDSVGVKEPYGHHVTMVDAYDGVICHTIEGNATGRGCDGTTYQGVVRRERPMKEWRVFIRPAMSDLSESR